MKKLLSVLLSILLVLPLTVTGFASESVINRVYADMVDAVAGEEISIPIKISGNTGFMGFMIFVSADRSIFKPVTVQKGDMLNGAFENSIGVSSGDTFRVIYSGTENITEDGTLFTIKLAVDKSAVGEKDISLSYSTGDTFDENYRDVVFNCESIKVNIVESSGDKPTDPQGEEKLSTKIRNWWNGLSKVLHYIVAPVVAPLIFVISLFE